VSAEVRRSWRRTLGGGDEGTIAAGGDPGGQIWHDPAVGIRNQPLRVIVVVGLWAMWVLWTITRFTSTVIASMPTAALCTRFQSCPSDTTVAVARQFSWSWAHFVFALIGAALLVAASVMILRTPRTVDEI
jgi:hypothetical protein